MISEQAKINRRERDRLKKQRKRARLKAAKAAGLATKFSKTSAAYRRQLGHAPEMTKAEMRRAIAAAVRNTQSMIAAT